MAVLVRTLSSTPARTGRLPLSSMETHPHDSWVHPTPYGEHRLLHRAR